MKLIHLPACFFFSIAFSRRIPTPRFTDIIESGTYTIINCDADLPPRFYPDASKVIAFLPRFKSSLLLLLADIQLGTASHHGYEALFKTNDSRAALSATIAGIITPSPLINNQRPTLVCIHDTEQQTPFQSLIEYCDGQESLYAIPGSSWIILCPTFFTLRSRGLDFPIGIDCPTVADNKIVDSIGVRLPLIFNMYSQLLYGMLQLHWKATTTVPTDIQNDLQEMVDLNATTSLSNIPNWVAYGACKFP